MKVYNTTIIKRLKEVGLTTRQAHVALTEVISTVGNALASGHPAFLKGLGSFRLSERKQRKYRLPGPKGGDNQFIEKPAHKSVVFRASPAIKESLKV